MTTVAVVGEERHQRKKKTKKKKKWPHTPAPDYQGNSKHHVDAEKRARRGYGTAAHR